MEEVKEKARRGDPDRAKFGKESPLGAGQGQDGVVGAEEAGGGEHFRPAGSTSTLRGPIPSPGRLLPDLLCGCES